MRSLLWKEFRENLKWAGLPALLVLVPTALLGGPQEPMFGGGGMLLFLIAAVFGAALGFLQFFFEARGDHRSLLLHRPLSPSRIFLGKALAGAGLYLLAQGVPFAAIEVWKSNSTGNGSFFTVDAAPNTSNGQLVAVTWSASSSASYFCP